MICPHFFCARQRFAIALRVLFWTALNDRARIEEWTDRAARECHIPLPEEGNHQ